MRVIKDKNGLLIMPETEFEETILCEMFPRNNDSKHTVFMKCGASVGDIVGLKVVAQSSEESDQA